MPQDTRLGKDRWFNIHGLESEDEEEEEEVVREVILSMREGKIVEY